jgi:hypothetical protein
MSYRPRIRSLKPELWRDQELQMLSAHARLLFIGLISNADDEGRLEGNVALIRSIVFPCDVDVTTRKVDAWLTTLTNSGFIVRYEVASRPFVAICNWKKHQRVDKPSPSEIPSHSESVR